MVYFNQWIVGLISYFLILNFSSAFEGDFDREITIFSPKGRLYQIEYAVQAVSNFGASCAAIKGKDFCVLASKKKIPDLLVDPSSVTNIFKISEEITCLISGHEGDVRHQVQQLRIQAMSFKRQFGHEIPAQILARKVADQAQVRTQQASKRPLGCTALLMSLDPELGPQLLKIDPTGQFLRCKGMCLGKGDEASLSYMESAIEATESDDSEARTIEESIKVVIGCLVKASLEEEEELDVTADNIEVAVISKRPGYGLCQLLNKEEILSFMETISDI